MIDAFGRGFGDPFGGAGCGCGSCPGCSTRRTLAGTFGMPGFIGFPFGYQPGHLGADAAAFNFATGEPADTSKLTPEQIAALINSGTLTLQSIGKTAKPRRKRGKGPGPRTVYPRKEAAVLPPVPDSSSWVGPAVAVAGVAAVGGALIYALRRKR